MRIFRLHRAQRAASDFSGSLIYQGRWNPAGTPMLYASTALSLSCLELLVHLTPNLMPMDYVYSTADLESAPEIAGYRGDLADVDSARRFGHRWAGQRETLAIRVPSVIVPIEFNVLLNPTHAAFGDVIWGAPRPFRFDERLIRTASFVS
jgi:RES domain-containing protein